MLLKATRLDPENLIYEMVYLGSTSTPNARNYQQIAREAAPKVLEAFNGNGFLNRYFKQVLYRLDRQ